MWKKYKGSCNFSWFYKIHHLPKWLNLPFINYLLFYSCYQPQNCFGKKKIYICFEKQNVFDGKPQMTKNSNLKSWKCQILIFGHFGSVLIFQIQFVFVIFGFSLKTMYLSKQIYFCLTKTFFGMIVLIEKKIYFKRQI